MEPQEPSNSNEREIAAFLKEVTRFLDPSSIRTIVELGSRDAEVALALKRAFPQAHVFAFECNPAAIELCRRNIAASGAEGVTLIPKAVSDTSGTVDFYAIDPIRTVTPHPDGNIGASSLFQANPDYPHEQYSQNRISVEALTLAQWARETSIAAIDLVWMDLQGAELKALHGMEDLLRNIKILYTEVEFKPVYLGQPLFPDIDRFLRQRGLRLHVKFNQSEWFGDAMYVQATMTSNPVRKLLRKLRNRKVASRVS
jgi:FkbM family methyltransferase